jgi:uncharacterized protein
MKLKFNPIYLVIFTLVVLSGFAQSKKENDLSSLRTISVSGEAEIKVVPDIIIFSISIETNNKNLKQAKKENDEKVTDVVSILKQFNVPEKNIQTDYFFMDKVYTRRKIDKSKGYEIRNTLEIKLTDISKFD